MHFDFPPTTNQKCEGLESDQSRIILTLFNMGWGREESEKKFQNFAGQGMDRIIYDTDTIYRVMIIVIVHCAHYHLPMLQSNFTVSTT